MPKESAPVAWTTPEGQLPTIHPATSAFSSPHRICRSWQNSATRRIPLQYTHSRSTHNNQRSDRHSRRNRHRWTNLTIRRFNVPIMRQSDGERDREWSFAPAPTATAERRRPTLRRPPVVHSPRRCRAHRTWAGQLHIIRNRPTATRCALRWRSSRVGKPTDIHRFNRPQLGPDPHANYAIQSFLGLRASRPRLTRSAARDRRING